MHMIHIITIFFKRFYLFIHDRERERGRDTGRGRSRLHATSLMQDSIPEPQDHALGQRQTLNHWATQGSPLSSISLSCVVLEDSLTPPCSHSDSLRGTLILSVGLTFAAQWLQPHSQMSPVSLRSEHFPHHHWNTLCKTHTWGYHSPVLVFHDFLLLMKWCSDFWAWNSRTFPICYKLPTLQSPPLRMFLSSCLHIWSHSILKSLFLYKTLRPPQTGLF